jgi:hypothetical protein
MRLFQLPDTIWSITQRVGLDPRGLRLIRDCFAIKSAALGSFRAPKGHCLESTVEGHGPGFFTFYDKAASNETETTRNELNSLSCALNGVWELKQTRFCVLLVVLGVEVLEMPVAAMGLCN